MPVEGYQEFIEEQRFAQLLNTRYRKQAWAAVRKSSLEALRGIKRRMPVDTGAARARWGSPGSPAYPGGIWEENEPGLRITQGAALSPHEYIAELNQGTSTQAPAGFIDAEAQKAEETLAEDLLDAFVNEWRK